VAHRETLAAEGIAAALARFPALAMVGVATSAPEAELRARRADAVAIDARISGAHGAVARMRKRGVRVVVIGRPRPGDEVEDGVTVPVDASVAHLASALAPGVGVRRDPALSPREAEVLRLAAKGMPGKQIARVLGISAKTVEQHKTRAFKRLGVPNQAAAVALMSGGGGSWSPSTT
jgi:DNA-binding CsgD family transcriptional regulator